MKYIFYDYYKNKVKTAVKAREDAKIIAENNGYISIPLFCREEIFLKKIFSINRAIKSISKDLKKEKQNFIVIQYPYRLKLMNYIIKKIKNRAKIIILIHDIDYIRNCNTDSGEIAILNKADYIIAHNDKMIKRLVDDGVLSNKLYNLEIFDYISDESISKSSKCKNNVVIFAGFLGYVKSGFIYKVNPVNYLFSLYGVQYEGSNNENIVYNGAFPSSELISNMDGHYGLVWDGDSTNECSGKSGNYLRYNNPHKTSLYISAGIPIVIWKESALSSFILKNKIGVVISSLDELNDLPKYDSEEYLLMKQNVLKIREKINNGFYFSSKLREIEKNEKI